MLEITIPDIDFFDDETNEFVSIKGVTLRLEHSLVSLSKWESIWKIPFLSNSRKTLEQTRSYVMCMTMNQNVDPLVYTALTNEQIKEVNDYISEERTATTFNNLGTGHPNRDVITSELIYYWMTSYNIPFECQKWHLSRLLTLIRIASVKNSPEKKMSKSAILSQNRALNEARRKAMHTKG